MSNITLTDIYSVQTNFFKLNVQNVGQIYSLSKEEIDRNPLPCIRSGDRFITWVECNGIPEDLTINILQRLILWNFREKIRDLGFETRGKYRIYHPDNRIPTTQDDFYKLYRGLNYRIVRVMDDLFLCVDPSVFIDSCAPISFWHEKGVSISKLSGFSVKITDSLYRLSGYLVNTIQTDPLTCSIKIFRSFETESSLAAKDASFVYPEARPEVLDELFRACGIRHSTSRLIRKNTFIDDQTPGKNRLASTLSLVETLYSDVFPLNFASFDVSLRNEPTVVRL